MVSALTCSIVDGLIPTERIARIHAADGEDEEVSVSTGSISGDKLIVSEIVRDEGMVLVELPRESAAGHWRIWVNESEVDAPSPAGETMDILKAASDPEHVGIKNEIAQDRLDAQRYQKLKAWAEQNGSGYMPRLGFGNVGFDAAVDSLELPGPQEASVRPLAEVVLIELYRQSHSPMQLLSILTDDWGYSPSDVRSAVADLLYDGQLVLGPDRTLRVAG